MKDLEQEKNFTISFCQSLELFELTLEKKQKIKL
jgi:hypothetical protein